MTPVTLRICTEADWPALRRLAERDSSPTPRGRVLAAELEGELRAALALESGELIADPFRPTAELVELLRTRAAQLERAGKDRSARGKRLAAGRRAETARCPAGTGDRNVDPYTSGRGWPAQSQILPPGVKPAPRTGYT